MSYSGLHDVWLSSNTIVKDNWSTLSTKITEVRKDLAAENDYEYDNFYKRINWYFSTIINEFKLNYIESMRKYEEEKAGLEKDIWNLIMENMILKIENNHYEEKNLLNTSQYINMDKSEFYKASDSIKYIADNKYNNKIFNNNNNNKGKTKPHTNSPLSINSLNNKMKKSRNTCDNAKQLPQYSELNCKTELKNKITVTINNKWNAGFNVSYTKKECNLNEEIMKRNNYLQENANVGRIHKRNFGSIWGGERDNIYNKNSSNINPNQTKTRINNSPINLKTNVNVKINANHNISHNNQGVIVGEKSMFNLPSYCWDKGKVNENRIKLSLNDLNPNSQKKNLFNIVTTTTYASYKSGMKPRTKSRDLIRKAKKDFVLNKSTSNLGSGKDENRQKTKYNYLFKPNTSVHNNSHNIKAMWTRMHNSSSP